MLPSEDPGQALARRLRALREEHWAYPTITQGQLAEALDPARPLSVPLISSWESLVNPKVPPLSRLAAYATFFATPRSVARKPYRTLELSELTEQERANREELLQELSDLRAAAMLARRRSQQLLVPGPAGTLEPVEESMWRFPEGEPVIIVDTALPTDLTASMPYADPRSPDYMELYTYADPDAVTELYGHIRAMNPHNRSVRYRTANKLRTDDLTGAHLVLLGGVDWNEVTTDLLGRIELPVRQVGRDLDEPEGFEVEVDGQRRRFSSVVQQVGGRELLVEDIAHLFRGPNPYNHLRTVTLCNGMYGRGTYGAVRTFTDHNFRDRNERYLRGKFAGQKSFSLVMRVQVVNGRVVTPDFTAAGTVVHEWPEATR